MQQFVKVMAGIGVIFIVGLLVSVPTMLLWNGCLVPAVDGVHEITVLQALGLSVLASFFFRSFK